MTLQQLPGMGMRWPYLRDLDPNYTWAAGFSTAITLDASTEMGAFTGRVWWPGRSGTKDIRKVHFRCGAVTLNAASSFRVSLQDLSATVGPPMNPDGVVDQSWVTATLSANAWNVSGNLSADRTVAFGALLAVVFDYATFTAADSVVISALSNSAVSTAPMNQQAMSLLNTGVWGIAACMPNVILEFSDGTFGTLYGTTPVATVTTITWSNTAGDDARGMEFSVPFPCKVDGFWIAIAAATTGTFEVSLYDGTTPMTNGTVSFDSDVQASTNGRIMFCPFPAELELAAGATYRLAVRPTSADNVNIYGLDLNDAAHRAVYGGPDISYNTLTDGGGWGSPLTTRVPVMALNISSLDDGAGGGGGHTLNRVRLGR